MPRLPEDKRDLLDRPIVVTLATVMSDYSPQATPVWFSYDGTHIWINTARGRQKDRNMLERPTVSILSVDPDNPYRYLEVRGVVDEVTEDGAVDHINFLSGRYTGNTDYYGDNPQRRQSETRVIFKIKPTKFVG
jgi:PPOX class probable F420-dependent enzyme